MQTPPLLSWLEQLTVNQRVLGSSPRGGASYTVTLHILNLREIGGFFFRDILTKNLLKGIKSWQLFGNYNFSFCVLKIKKASGMRLKLNN